MPHSLISASPVGRGVIHVQGARQNNLRDVTVTIPRDALVVFTGLSGSGKSSLAFDTIFAEGQRRYVESLSSYARMFLDQVEPPDVESIDGLSPAVAIDQGSTSRNPRSTVGTVTEIADHLRLLWARVGLAHCTVCGAPVQRQTVQQIVDSLLHDLAQGVRFQVLATVISRQKGTHREVFAELQSQGFSRVVVNGSLEQLTDPPNLDKRKQHDISVVVDRLVAQPEIGDRLSEAVELALGLGAGSLTVEVFGADGVRQIRTFSEHLACPHGHPNELTEIEPRTFSFNSPMGACTRCSGLGTREEVDHGLLIGDPSLSLAEGVLRPWAQAGAGQSRYFESIISALAATRGFSMSRPWRALDEADRDALLHGDDQEIRISRSTRLGRDLSYTTTFEGLVTYVERKHAEAETDAIRARWSRYLRAVPCTSCNGARLKPAVLAVKVGGLSIAEFSDLDLTSASTFLHTIELTSVEQAIAGQLIREIDGRLQFLLDVGLHYLTLARSAGSLSGGEAQRIRLATQVGSGLTGVLYVLDEPSIGLHQRDNDRLIATLKRLKEVGNSVLVVEHDEDTIRAADWIVDVGPAAGEHGGKIVYSGALEGLLTTAGSLTADYLAGTRTIDIPGERRPFDGAEILKVEGARENNLKDVDVEIPLRRFVAVTGVSGSGKSTLVNDILHRSLANELNGASTVPGHHRRVSGFADLDKVVHVDQAPIGRTPRSNPATYTGVFDRIRALFAETTEAKVRGYTAGRFSFNVRGGRCEDCRGDGTVKIEMNFLSDVYVECETCHGQRFNRDTLQVTYKGKTIADVLEMPISEAAVFFSAFQIISRYLDALAEVGLGYVRLGQSATTLSGGEAQRIKLATELQRRTRGRNIYILDEPTTGLHFEDVRHLLQMLHRLVDQGNSVVLIEHNLDVIKTADWVIDLGPEGGAGGGQVIAAGTPEAVAEVSASATGRYLKRALAR